MQLLDRILVGGLAAAVVVAGVAGWLLFGAPSPGGMVEPTASSSGASVEAPASAAASVADDILVDVEGGVAEPGIQQLPAGSRVADAIVAAGGYGGDADLAAAARGLNLAAPLGDGQQVYVPRVGDGSAAAASGDGGSAGGGPVNLNQATPEQLDALPGIGPVTVQKIVAARQERPFSSLDELVERKVLTSSQLAKIRDQVTV
jgi:competence protein ComEA